MVACITNISHFLYSFNFNFVTVFPYSNRKCSDLGLSNPVEKKFEKYLCKKIKFPTIWPNREVDLKSDLAVIFMVF